MSVWSSSSESNSIDISIGTEEDEAAVLALTNVGPEQMCYAPEPILLHDIEGLQAQVLRARLAIRVEVRCFANANSAIANAISKAIVIESGSVESTADDD